MERDKFDDDWEADWATSFFLLSLIRAEERGER